MADRLAALASVAAGQASAIERFAQDDADAANGALQIVAFADPDELEPSGEMRRAGAP